MALGSSDFQFPSMLAASPARGNRRQQRTSQKISYQLLVALSRRRLATEGASGGRALAALSEGGYRRGTERSGRGLRVRRTSGSGCTAVRRGQPRDLLIGLGTAAAEAGYRVKYTLATKRVRTRDHCERKVFAASERGRIRCERCWNRLPSVGVRPSGDAGRFTAVAGDRSGSVSALVSDLGAGWV